jgi:hypothetical protein
MMSTTLNRRDLMLSLAAVAAIGPASKAFGAAATDVPPTQAREGTSVTFTKMAPPAWLTAFWKEIDDKTWGKGFDCFAEDAVAHLGVSDWHGREGIRKGLHDFVDKNLTAHHEVVEYWDSPKLKVFRGFVTMVFTDTSIPTARPAMTHFFYMDDKDPSKVIAWYGSVGPTSF